MITLILLAIGFGPLVELLRFSSSHSVPQLFISEPLYLLFLNATFYIYQAPSIAH